MNHLHETLDLYRLLRRNGNGMWWSLKTARRMARHPKPRRG